MAKIGIGRFRWNDHWGDYDIMYSSKDKEFYTDAGKLFPGAGEFFDSLLGSGKPTEGLTLHQYSYGRMSQVKQISALTQTKLEESVNLFNRLFVEVETSEEKVILYVFDYHTETQQANNDRFNRFENVQKLSMEFKYHIAMKKTLGENKLYTKISTQNRVDRYDVHNYKEIPWSQELEDFIISFSKSFDILVNKMKPFFEIDGKIVELIGKNILMP
jgi:hypothetical protein